MPKSGVTAEDLAGVTLVACSEFKATTWAGLQQIINAANETQDETVITLEADITAQSTDMALLFDGGKHKMGYG